MLAPLCPALWLGVVIICDLDRRSDYDTATSELSQSHRPQTLILENPEWPGAPVPVFRHHGSEPGKRLDAAPVFVATPRPRMGNIQAHPAQTVLDIARAMRGNVSSQHRREPKQLPSPAVSNSVERTENLPFLKPYPQA